MSWSTVRRLTRGTNPGGPIGRGIHDVYDRLNAIGSNIFAAQRLGQHSRSHPDVVASVVQLLGETAELAAELPESLLAVDPELPWSRLATMRAGHGPEHGPDPERVWNVLDEIAPLADAMFIAISGRWLARCFRGDRVVLN